MLAEERRKTGHYKTIFTSGMELDNASIYDNLLLMSKLNSRPRKINGFKTPNYFFLNIFMKINLHLVVECTINFERIHKLNFKFFVVTLH